MPRLANLTRSDVAFPVEVYQSDNPLVFKYVLPTRTIKNQGVTCESIDHAILINSAVAIQMFDSGLVAKVVLVPEVTGNTVRDAIRVTYKDGLSAEKGNDIFKTTLLNYAANVRKDGKLVNPHLSLQPEKPQIPSTAEVQTMAVEKFNAMKVANPKADEGQLSNRAVILTIIDVFAKVTNKTHGGGIEFIGHDPASKTLSVKFTQGCADCKTGQEVTRGNLEKMMIFFAPPLVQKVRLAP